MLSSTPPTCAALSRTRAFTLGRSIGTKAESGQHPNKVVVKNATLDAVKAAIAEVDQGRDKFTIVE